MMSHRGHVPPSFHSARGRRDTAEQQNNVYRSPTTLDGTKKSVKRIVCVCFFIEVSLIHKLWGEGDDVLKSCTIYNNF